VEKEDLDKWLLESEKNKALYIELTEKKSLIPELEKYYAYDETGVRKKIEELRPKPGGDEKLIPQVHRIHFWKRYRWIAAASVILLLCLSGYLLFFEKDSSKTNSDNTAELKNDVVAPQTNRAIITLGDGRKITLDSLSSGTLAVQGNVKVLKTADGQIVYNGSSAQVVYNTLYNPRGSKVIDMILTDGSKVWLNAGSSVTYPVAFIANERKVTITGEAYFEVVHDNTKPFYVAKGDLEVQVLGTHFNVNAYDDENDIKVTLLEGSVKVFSNGQSVTIKPGEQAQLTSNLKPQIINGIDPDKVMAWKNGYFSFAQSDLQTVMRQIARWYDVEIFYEGKISERKFGGEISRFANLSQVLKVLQESAVNFRIEGRKIVVIN
jgi:transmembrane sensor